MVGEKRRGRDSLLVAKETGISRVFMWS